MELLRQRACIAGEDASEWFAEWSSSVDDADCGVEMGDESGVVMPLFAHAAALAAEKADECVRLSRRRWPSLGVTTGEEAREADAELPMLNDAVRTPAV
jgi:hypothetical protein